MDDLCWNCGSPSHHGVGCPEPPNPEMRKEMKKMFRKGSGKDNFQKRNFVQLEKWAERMEDGQRINIPPMWYYNAEVHRIDQVLQDLQSEVLRISSAISVSADCMQRFVQQLDQAQEILSEEQGKIRTVGAMKKLYKLEDEDTWAPDFILSCTVDILMDQQRELQDRLHLLKRNFCAAINVIKELDTKEELVVSYIHEGIEAFSGRPLRIPFICGEWKRMKNEMQSIISTTEKYLYLFNTADQEAIQFRFNEMKQNWKDLKAAKEEYHLEPSKFTCSVCREHEIEIAAIPCGHTFCARCIEGMGRCGMCRSEISKKQQLFFNF